MQREKLLIVLMILLAPISYGQNSGQNVLKTSEQAYQEHSPIAHHKIALEVLNESEKWINAFNEGNTKKCVESYHSNAVMRAMPFGVKKGSQAINNFWKPFIESGASNLVYTDVAIEVVNESTALISANWSMNVGRGTIYQEKWEKKDNIWKLTYDDFEVLEQFEKPRINTNPATASHQALEEVINASIDWINGFNSHNSTICGNGYSDDATMNAVPFTSLHHKAAIQEFWAKLIADGAKNLTYHNPKFTVIAPERVLVSSRWSMNIGEGKIYQEKWIKEKGKWILGYDEFQVVKQY